MTGSGNTALDVAREVADAVLLEGYVLYPYRASAQKNQIRWQFGVLAPPENSGSEPSHAQTEVLAEPGEHPVLQATVRFLQVQARTDGGADTVTWDEGVVCEVPVTARLDPAGDEQRTEFHIDGGEERDSATVRRRWPLDGAVVIRPQRIEGPYGAWKIRVRVENRTPYRASGGTADGAADRAADRAEMLRHSLVAAHTLLHLADGTFISLLEPPEWASPYAASCVNQHTWPVLVGEGRRDVMLSSPIILYDYPEVAGESPANLHDATEIDEILLLRTMALTDEEKAEARATDQRSADIIDQADHLPPEMMERLHGAIRYLREAGPARTGQAGEPPAGGPAVQGPAADQLPGGRRLPRWGKGRDDGVPVWGTVPDGAGDARGTGAAGSDGGNGAGEPDVPWWDPGADSSVSPETDSVAVPGGRASKGTKVRLRPGGTGTGGTGMTSGTPVMRRTDAQDMFADGRIATVQAVFNDVDGGSHLAVTLDDDPAAELHQWFGRYQYYTPAEVEIAAGDELAGGGARGGDPEAGAR